MVSWIAFRTNDGHPTASPNCPNSGAVSLHHAIVLDSQCPFRIIYSELKISCQVISALLICLHYLVDSCYGDDRDECQGRHSVVVSIGV